MESSRSLRIHYPQGTRSVVLATQDESVDLAELLRRADLPLNTRCGRHGLCDGCHIELLSGSLVNEQSGDVVSADDELGPICACEYLHRSTKDVEIRIPARSLLGHEPQIVTSFRLNVTRANAPLWQRIVLKAADLPTDVPLAEAIGIARRPGRAEFLVVPPTVARPSVRPPHTLHRPDRRSAASRSSSVAFESHRHR